MIKTIDSAAKSPSQAVSPRRRAKANFYNHALSEAEKEYSKRAKNVDGLDDEVAVLRAKILTVLEDRPNDLTLLMKAISTLSHTLAARHRLGAKPENELLKNLAGTLDGLGDQLFTGLDETGVEEMGMDETGVDDMGMADMGMVNTFEL